MLTGENGILTQTQRAKTETENAQKEEENILANYESVLNSYSGENTEFTDSLGNKVKVPAGFKVVNPEDNVEDGIIIEDVTHGATAGSQFVWIPVGTGIKKADGTTFDVNLSRYTFDTNGTPTDQGDNVISSYYQEMNTGKGNTTTKEDIESEEAGFRKSAIDSRGYYIGRHEARTTKARANKDEALTQVTVKSDDYVYTYVAQPEAASLSQKMYNSEDFKSDLMNSYAWDTAIDFLQKCDNRTDTANPYSTQTSLNTESLAEKGTIGTAAEDVICNIYDMASNCWEWTTETSSLENFPSVGRGGVYGNKSYGVAGRYYGNATDGYGDSSFRPIIYL